MLRSFFVIFFFSTLNVFSQELPVEMPSEDYIYDAEKQDNERFFYSQTIPVELPDNAVSISTSARDMSYFQFAESLLKENEGDLSAALDGYKKTLETAADNEYVHRQALSLALETGMLEKADTWADFLIAKDSSSAENWVLYGNLKWSKEDRESAAKAYIRAQELDKNNTEALFQYASLISADNPEEAVKYLKRYIEIKPEDSAELYYRIAVLYNLKENAALTGEYLLKAVQEDDFHIPARYMLAELYEVNKDTSSALSVYLDLLRIDAKNIKLINHIAEIYLDSNQEEAEKYLRMAKSIDKSDETACFWLSAIAEFKKDYAEAARQLEESSALWKSPDTLMKLSYFYTQTDRYDSAVEILQKAYERFPDDNELGYYLALGYDDIRQTDKALVILDKLVRLVPDNREYRMQYAVICERENKIDLAEENFKAILKNDPNNAQVLNYLGYALADRGLKLEEANQMIARALQKDPENGAYLDSMAWAQYKSGDIDSAKTNIHKALTKITNDPIIWEHAGDISRIAGDMDYAWKAYKIAYTLEEKNKQKLLAVKIKKSQKSLSKQSAASLTSWYLNAFSPKDIAYSFFGTLSAKIKGNNLKIDAVLAYNPKSGFTISLIGPLYNTVWRGQVKDGKYYSDDIVINGVKRDDLNTWAMAITRELNDVFSGQNTKADFKNWSKKCFTGDTLSRVCLGKNGLPSKIKSSYAPKMTVQLSDYFLYNLYIFPKVFEFKIPFFKIKLELKSDVVNITDVNKISITGEVDDKN